MKKNLHFLQLLINVKKQNCFRNLLFVIVLFISKPSFSQNPLQLANPIPGGSGRSIQKIVATKSGNTFFNTIDANNHFSNLWGLWTTDGTATGTKKMTLTSPPVPGGTNSFISTEATQLTALSNNKILFAGDDEQGYGEIWVSDGTQAGTFVLEQFFGSAFSGPPVQNITTFGNSGIYSVVTNDNKLQLHKTDGTYAGTSLVYDFGDYNNYSVNYFKAIGTILYFEVNNNTTTHNEIWRTDGTATGTTQVKDLGQDYGFASDFMSFNNNIYFITISSTYGDYIWKSDGTSAGTAPLKQISTSFNYENLFPSYAATSTKLYFAANNSINGKELWQTDGTTGGTGMVQDQYVGSTGSNPNNLTVLNDKLYYTDNSSYAGIGDELNQYDGSLFTARDIFLGTTGSNISNITVQNSTLLFSAANSTATGNELWVADGLTNVFEIANINPGANSSSNPSLISINGNTAYFAANVDVNYDGIDDPCIYKYTAPQEMWTGSISNNASDPNNWFPAITPGSKDNVVIAAGATNALGNNPFFFCNDLYNNGTINVGNGTILINGNFFNSGAVSNTVPGVFAVVSNSSLPIRIIGSSGTFNGQLTLSGGVNARLTSFSYFPQLRIEGADTIYLGSYSLQLDNLTLLTPKIVTDSVGQFSMPVGASPVIFPVMADATSYTPVTIVNHDGIPGRYFYVNVKNGVYTNGTSGNLVTQQAVNKTWDIIESNIQSSNADITLQWNASDELPGFDINNVYLNHFTSGTWDSGTPGVAGGSGPYSFTRTGFTTFSPFSISSATSVLPVNLISFSANKINNAIQLNWQIASEKNISFYNIERSKDGNSFESLNQLEATGNNYSYVDQQPFAGTDFYRLKMIDTDGKFTYSKVVAIKMDSENVRLQIFPNPARNILNIQVNGYSEKALLQIIDITGRNVKEEKISLNGTTSVAVDVNNLPKGTYEVILKGNSINEQKKLVKE